MGLSRQRGSITSFSTDLYLNLEPSLMNPTSLGGRSACDNLKNEWFSTPTFQSRFVALKLPSLKLNIVAT